MATAYTPILKLALPVTGELNGAWGDVVNNNITSMVEQAVAGLATVNTWVAASSTLTTADGTTSQSRCAILECSGAPGAAATVICPAASKVYILKNSVTGGYAVTLKTSAGTGISVPNGSTALLYCDGTNVVSGATYMATLSTTQVDILAQGDLRLQDSTGGEYVALQAPATLASSYTLTLPVDDGTSGQALITDGSGVLSWSSAASGDVYGPASATDNAIARFDGTTGKIIQNSAVTIGDDGATVIAANSSSDGLRITQTGAGNALLVEDSANPDATPTVIAADGVVRIGSLTNNNTVYGTSQFAPGFQLYNTAGTGGFYRYAADADGSALIFAKSRNATVGSQTVVNSSDTLGYLGFAGSDGTNFTTGATITAQVDGTPGTGNMPGRLVFSTTADGASSPTERMRIDSAGNVGIGGTAFAGAKTRVTGSTTAVATSYSMYLDQAIQSGVTSAFSGISTGMSVANTAFTLPELRHFYADQGTKGASATVTNQYGFNVASSLTGATNNYGFYGNIASGTGRWNFYAAGTADNYFAGKVGIGTTTPAQALQVSNSAGDAVALISGGTGAAGYVAVNGNARSSLTGAILMIAYSSGAAELNNKSNGNFAFATNDTERMRIASSGTISLGAAPGAESLRVTPVASAVNYFNVYGAAAGGAPTIYADGSSASLDFNVVPKGASGAFNIFGNGNVQFRVAPTASAVNYLQVTGGATGATTTLSAQGSDTNVDITLTPKGDGYVVVDSAYSPNLTLTDAATIAWNTGTAGGQVATFTFVSTNRTMGAPTNLKNGGFYALAVIQNAGGNTLTWSSIFKWANGTAPTLSTGAGAKDYFVFRSDGTNLYQQGISQAVA